MRDALAAELVDRLERLGRWFRGRLIEEPAPSDEVVPAEKYLDIEFLRSAIARAASIQPQVAEQRRDIAVEDGADLDLRIAVSRFTRQYVSSISAVALVGLAYGVGLDLSPARCRMIIRSNVPFLVHVDIRAENALRCAERPNTLTASGPVLGTLDALRAYVWEQLYAHHIAPLFSRAMEVTKVSPRLMWSNAAEWVGNASDSADEYLNPSEATPFFEDRIAILDAPSLPGIAGPNPLTGLLAWCEPTADFPHGQHVRSVCCVTFYLPDRLGRLCQNCPFLPVNDRLALIRERHGVPMGSPGGPAERLAIKKGLVKLDRATTSRSVTPDV